MDTNSHTNLRDVEAFSWFSDVWQIGNHHEGSGCWGIQRSGIKEEAVGRGTAAESGATAT
jgi:hypothetical protein